MSSTIFGLQSSYILEYCWLFTLFLRRSARCFTGAQGEVDSAPTYLATMFSLSSFILIYTLHVIQQKEGKLLKSPNHYATELTKSFLTYWCSQQIFLIIYYVPDIILSNESTLARI